MPMRRKQLRRIFTIVEEYGIQQKKNIGYIKLKYCRVIQLIKHLVIIKCNVNQPTAGA